MPDRACTSCGTANEADARFCEGCGTALERSCGTCGVAASATARFCRSCGASLDDQGQQPVSSPTRKTVTVLFADLAGSTAFEELVDPETAREVIGQYHELLRSTAERHRAGVTKYIGDGFMAVWGVPEIGAGDAGHAVDAAVELQERFVGLASRLAEAHHVELALRVAVNTGEVVVGTDDADLVGDALNVGARLESECPHGHVVVGEETWRATRGQHRFDPRGAVHVKGRTAAVPVYQWLGRADAAESVPFVGRSIELQRMRTVFDDAAADRTARLVTIIGDPGVGKTRLAGEFVGNLGDDVRVIRAHCAVEGTPAMTPFVDVLRTRDLDADIPTDVIERDRILRDLSGMTAGVAGSAEEAFWALRRYLEVLAVDGPLIVLVDDIQWADGLLLDFVEHLVEWVRAAPVLLVTLARPELQESRPDLVTVGGWVSEALRLRGLEARDTAELAARVLGSDQLPDELLSRLPASTGGNPLFVRELVGMLVHDGVLIAQPGGWRLTVDVDAISIPPTIQALLASRLERLSLANRRVLEVASVIGTDFSPSAVAALAGVGSAEIVSALNRLRRLDLAQPSGTYAGDEPVWRFHHVLIRDVAYRRLLKSERADLHERLANWVHAGGASVAFEADEVIARNLEAAHGYRCDLGLRDGHTGELALRSARNYLASARRALDRDELSSAGSQAARGASLAAADTALHAELLLVGCESNLSAGDVAAGAPLVDELENVAGQELAPWAICYRCQLTAYTEPTRLPEVDARLTEAIDEFAERKDAAGLAKAHRVRATARARLGRIGDCEADLFEALIAARQGGDHRQITAALGAAPNAALWGPSPAPKAGGRCLDVVRMQRMTTAAPSLEATSLRCLAVLELLRGRPDKARSMLADARQVVADLGLRHGLMETELFTGIIELMAGDAVAAEPHFRVAMEGLGALGVGADAGQAAALLARSVLAQGRLDEADRYASESEHRAGHNLKTAIAWRSARAEILSAHGQHDQAAAMGRDAVAVASGTDLVLDHAEACLALSRVLLSAGDQSGAAEANREAQRLYAVKDAVFMVERPTPPTPDGAGSEAVQSPATGPGHRFRVSNNASAVGDGMIAAMQAHDTEGVLAFWSDQFVYADHRHISGNPIRQPAELRIAVERIWQQYTNFEAHNLAVRGDKVYLGWSRWSDDAGNEARYIGIYELNSDGLVCYHSRFDVDDFWPAYRDMETHYYASEGAQFATNGVPSAEWVVAISEGDIDAVRRASDPDFRWLAPPGALKAKERSVDDMFRWMQERGNQVSSQRHWVPVLQWLSPTCSIGLGQIEATRTDGGEFRWNFLFVNDCRDGVLKEVCEFDVADEDEAFAYAERLVARQSGRLPTTNRSCEIGDRVIAAMRSGDVVTASAYYSDDVVYDDHRRLGGDPIIGPAAVRTAFERLHSQYSEFALRTLAVRGDDLRLGRATWTDDTGNQSTVLMVGESSPGGQIIYQGTFDEDDFDGAYRELERRFYSGAAASHASAATGLIEMALAENRGDLDSTFNMFAPGLQIESRSRSVFPRRSAAELRRSVEELGDMVPAYRVWASAICWVTDDVMVVRHERATDDQKYSWTRIYAGQVRNGVFTALCEFDAEDEEAAFAYAKELTHRIPSRLALTNRACEMGLRGIAGLNAHDPDAAAAAYGDHLEYEDHRRISGQSLATGADVRAAVERICAQYDTFEGRALAVRGDTLELGWLGAYDQAGNQTSGLVLIELGADGHVLYEGRFDESDFDRAYRELERRYYAGEGSAFAEAGATLTEFAICASENDLDRVLNELTVPDLRVESRSRSIYPMRTAEEFRDSVAEFIAQASSLRTWFSAILWLAPNLMVGRHERESVGADGETYEWTRIYVGEFRGGLLASFCDFDIEFEAEAFAYAEELMRTGSNRLTLASRAGIVVDRLGLGMKSGDVRAALECVGDDYIQHDRRHLTGGPIQGKAEAGRALERILAQFTNFDARVLAVRGESLALFWSRWSDEAGNETSHLHLVELDERGLIGAETRFDPEDFEGAYRELETRYHAAEGAAAARSGLVNADIIVAMNGAEFDALFRDLIWPEFRIENRSRSGFPNRSADDLRASLEALEGMVASVRAWLSSLCWLSPDVFVGRLERVGHGDDGERFEWARILVAEYREGRLARLCDFDATDEDGAFAYANEILSQ